MELVGSLFQSTFLLRHACGREASVLRAEALLTTRSRLPVIAYRQATRTLRSRAFWSWEYKIDAFEFRRKVALERPKTVGQIASASGGMKGNECHERSGCRRSQMWTRRMIRAIGAKTMLCRRWVIGRYL